jgi:hypothetical protein
MLNALCKVGGLQLDNMLPLALCDVVLAVQAGKDKAPSPSPRATPDHSAAFGEGGGAMGASNLAGELGVGAGLQDRSLTVPALWFQMESELPLDARLQSAGGSGSGREGEELPELANAAGRPAGDRGDRARAASEHVSGLTLRLQPIYLCLDQEFAVAVWRFFQSLQFLSRAQEARTQVLKLQQQLRDRQLRMREKEREKEREKVKEPVTSEPSERAKSLAVPPLSLRLVSKEERDKAEDWPRWPPTLQDAVFASPLVAAGTAERSKAAADGERGAGASAPVYIRHAYVADVDLSVSIILLPPGAADVKLTQNELYNGVAALLGQIQNARVPLKGKSLTHFFSSWSYLRSVLLAHYLDRLYNSWAALLGAAGFLGNPLGLWNSLSKGTAALVGEPSAGLARNDLESAGLGLAMGTASFMREVVTGVAGTASGLTGAFGNAFALASSDRKYLRERTMRRARQPKHMAAGVGDAGLTIGRGIVDGVAGVFISPLEGAKEDGFRGLGKGVMRGLIGLAVKPLTGVFDAATSLSEGIRNTATGAGYRPANITSRTYYLVPLSQISQPRMTMTHDDQLGDELFRRRLPRSFLGPHRLLRPFDATAGCFLLRSVEAPSTTSTE